RAAFPRTRCSQSGNGARFSADDAERVPRSSLDPASHTASGIDMGRKRLPGRLARSEQRLDLSTPAHCDPTPERSCAQACRRLESARRSRAQTTRARTPTRPIERLGILDENGNGERVRYEANAGSPQSFQPIA